ncbi:unnamed protein product [Pleuronectes platessa]|uniref:Uncharacterized protein n=1 Tax=Pleuronectes platessa TaxID=8262 RepID=A0A9N7VSV5_PLEPL|nr:unnamed protein product [Pleuronectes platessa]
MLCSLLPASLCSSHVMEHGRGCGGRREREWLAVGRRPGSVSQDPVMAGRSVARSYQSSLPAAWPLSLDSVGPSGKLLQPEGDASEREGEGLSGEKTLSDHVSVCVGVTPARCGASGRPLVFLAGGGEAWPGEPGAAGPLGRAGAYTSRLPLPALRPANLHMHRGCTDTAHPPIITLHISETSILSQRL